VTDLATAELVKTAANAFLATEMSFVNAMAEVCGRGGVVTVLAGVLGHAAAPPKLTASPPDAAS